MSRRDWGYRGQAVAFLTRHGKQALVSAPLEHALGCRILHTDAYDTDRLGTFTRDVERMGSQLEAARRKARIGMALLDADIGMASEGAFGGHPATGLLPWNVEVLLWLDARHSLEVVGVAQGPASNWQAIVQSEHELMRFATRAGFPSHHLTLRPAHADHPATYKGLSDEVSLRHAFAQCLAEAGNGRVCAESELRAFGNPTRQQLIVQAAQDLVRKLASACPQCGAPGYWVARHWPGLPCHDCGEATTLPRVHVWACGACGHSHEQPAAAVSADPSRCGQCNP